MRFVLRLILCLVSLHLISGGVPVEANESSPSSEAPLFETPVKFTLLHEEASIQPGHPFWVAIQLDIQDHWHTYWKNPGDAGMPLMVDWELPEGFEASPLTWPTPKRFSLASSTGFGYEGKAVFLVQITPPSSHPESEIALSASARWVVCSDSTCLPGDEKQTIRLPVKHEEPIKLEKERALFTEARLAIPKKHEGVTAQRKNQLIEIAFEDSTEPSREIQGADFFPEHKKTVNSNVPNFFQKDSESGLCTIVVQELSMQETLKGVLIVHTSTGNESYEVETQIVAEAGEGLDVSMAASLGVEFPEETVKPVTKHSFEFEGGVGLAIVLAFVGGMILNLMPCVLPVISFKVLGFIKLAGQSRKLIFRHGLAFSLGVLVSFWSLAALLLILQAYGRSVGWGFQLQEPLFVAILATVLFIFGLSLFGVFELGTSIMTAAGEAQQKINQRNQLLSSFVSGILATAVATPCTGPFLGSAVGFAVTLPALQAMLIFTSLGLGMSFPYLALAGFPKLLSYMPKAGPWMVTFKELMGLLMMASVVWLVWVFSAQTSSFSVSFLLAALFLFACSCWVYGKWVAAFCKRWVRGIGMLVAALFFGMGGYTLVMSSSPWVEAMGTPVETGQQEIADAWEVFSPERVAELREQGIPVFIDFTAKWCLICQANLLVLDGDDVSEAFNERGVVKMKADWTKRDEVIAGELKKFGRNSVPLYVLYDNDPESDPQILPQVLTSDVVLDSLQQF